MLFSKNRFWSGQKPEFFPLHPFDALIVIFIWWQKSLNTEGVVSNKQKHLINANAQKCQTPAEVLSDKNCFLLVLI